ncbi:MAG: transketolase family protein [Elusimicrobia bacterium]|nr:transketolase family protein [Elusimicrobiota bacterium]
MSSTKEFIVDGKGLTWTVDTLDQLTQAEIYGKVLTDMARVRPDIVVCCADLLKSTKLREFQRTFPQRVFNFGISEQNMMSAAAGMSLEGLHPFVSTFGVFASMRACEQVRTDVVYQGTRVKIIATHSGLSFGQAGTTHHCTEDLAIMRSFARMTVIVPADSFETAQVIRALVDHEGPAYVRLGRGFEFPAYESDQFEFKIGKANKIKEGDALTVIACGVGVEGAKEAAESLEFDEGISIRVLDMHTIKPLDREAVQKAARETKRIITVEEHNIIGGLGSAVAEVLAEEGVSVRFKRLGIPDTFCQIGYPEDLYKVYGIDSDGIIKAVQEMLKV